MRKSIFLLLILIAHSCQKKKSEKTQSTELNTETEVIKSEKLMLNDTIVYLSGDNDLALIKLTLIPNGTFDFYMSIYPEPMQNAEPESDIINSNGTWIGNEKTVLLNFSERKKDTLNLNDLFDSNYKEENEFKVIDQNTVEIDYTLDKLNIWGIGCYKTEHKESIEIAYNWEYIKSKSSQLAKSFDIENLDIYKLSEIPKEFLELFIEDKRIEFGFPETLPINYPTEFRFYQYKEYNNFYFFNFIHANEYCCKTVYGVSIDKTDLKVINIAVFGLTGGDGGWSENDTGNWENDSLFAITKAQFNDDDLSQNQNEYEIDTLFAEIRINEKGVFNWRNIDSVKYRNGIKLK
jgi:hypothetical protein